MVERMSWLGAVAVLICLSAADAQVMVEAKPKPQNEWKRYETRRLEDLRGFTPGALVALTNYGGRADRREKATGFFRVQKIAGRWWLVDPEGGLFIHVGVASVRAQTQFGAKEAFAQRFGTVEKWAESTQEMFRASGFNGIGGFSHTEALSQAKKPLAYTVSLRLAAGYGRELGITHQQPGHTGFAGDVIPAIHPGFAAYCDKACQALAGKADPSLVGYYSDNELPVTMKMLDNALALDEANASLAPMRRAAWEWLRARRGAAAKAEDVANADREAFLGHAYETYLRITTAAIRRHDPNHLCLGPRLHGPARQNRAVWTAAGRHLDVIAYNYYGTWTPRPEDLANWHAWSGRPCMITEFYVKGADTPLPNATGAGWIVKTQADRGLFYQNFALGLLESKTCVGWHWFKYMDNDPADTTTDPSNRDSNKGMLTIRYGPYAPLVERMKALNVEVYRVVDWMDR